MENLDMRLVSENKLTNSTFSTVFTEAEANDWANKLTTRLTLARNGDVETMYQLGTNRVGLSEHQSTWLQQAADSGHAQALYDLAIFEYEDYRDWCSRKGYDFDEWDTLKLAGAFERLRDAADKGSASAQFDLAILQLEEFDLYEDDQEILESGVNFLKLASDQGHKEAQDYIEMIFARFKGVEI
jgi:TPR repeat protein